MEPCCYFCFAVSGSALAVIEKRVLMSESCKNKRSYHVQVTSVQGGNSCGGALLNPRWVITASHCAEQEVKLKFALNIKRYMTLKLIGKKLEQTIPVKQQLTFKDEEEKVYDIMLIKLNEDVSPELPTISYDKKSCSRSEEDANVKIGGTGAKKAGGNLKKKEKDDAFFCEVLISSRGKPFTEGRCATTQISQCGENDKPGRNYNSDEATVICAFKPGVESCFGDAGSAVEDNGKLHGIIVANLWISVHSIL